MNEATIRPENLRLRSHRNQAFFFFLITLLIYFPPPTVSENQITTTDLFIDNNNMSKWSVKTERLCWGYEAVLEMWQGQCLGKWWDWERQAEDARTAWVLRKCWAADERVLQRLGGRSRWRGIKRREWRAEESRWSNKTGENRSAAFRQDFISVRNGFLQWGSFGSGLLTLPLWNEIYLRKKS